MKENRDFKGVWIPKEVWLNPNLSIIEKCLLVEIDSLDNSQKGCFASNEYLANFFRLSESRMANVISDLKKRGFINQIYFDGRNRGLRIVKSEVWFTENGKAEYDKTVKQTSRRREHNNTVNNTDNNIDYNSSQTKFDTQNKDEIKNPFTRKKLDDLNARKEKEKEKSSAKKEKEKPEREPTELYQAYEIFCNFHESVSAAKYPRNFNGSYVINSIDGRNIKLLLQWIKTVSADNPLDNFLAFIKGVWALQDKYINTNFNIGLIYRQSTALYARIQNQNPVLNKQRREEQLNEEAADFLRKRYGIVN